MASSSLPDAPPAASSTATSTTTPTTTDLTVIPTNPQKKISLDGKIIAITGANRGIGLGIADCCLANGATAVYSLDISGVVPDTGNNSNNNNNNNNNNKTNNDFEAVAARYPGQLHALTADVTREDELTRAIDEIIAREGRIDGVVANAGRTMHKPALEFTAADIEGLWGVNLYGSFYAARVAARAFIRLGIAGSVVFTASMASHRPNKRVPSAPYGASKAGIRNMTKTLALEWSQYNIRVNSVSPGLVKTAMTSWVSRQPDWATQLHYYGGLPRLASVEEVGSAYVYLLSGAAGYVTGVDVQVNGGIGIC
ncbi:NAD(P)-binding protein [Pseudovirgaria hyperparasitica]|uniref:NAD(P)-binding protein n=1 Tax=Pseudovirgaria hyperparasitica TaxID=470096 RepID=A0A6A6WKR7_9PEZI|nr:NAD(P)-binding protein [Pseudovirgaria hyperparasitica]KAF2762763.1 NAD(P)-binding protein [Pseudovirgaria hyperparasitica]